uniref:Craniofacial development protein 2-like n=1 Tax=Nicotiana tabacum TaxID=4097 RepID=A0A1S3Y834_TOBAC|nr:PREDICTED: craniofacial development protein 2-like [Nicotiana tabacum]
MVDEPVMASGGKADVWELEVMARKESIKEEKRHETRWVVDKAQDVDSFKLRYSGRVWSRNGIGILVDKDLRELVVEVRMVNDKLMTIKLVVGGFTLNIISAHATQAGLDEEVKRHFWEDLDEMVRGIPHTEKLFIEGDFNVHIGASELEFFEEEGALCHLSEFGGRDSD